MLEHTRKEQFGVGTSPQGSSRASLFFTGRRELMLLLIFFVSSSTTLCR